MVVAPAVGEVGAGDGGGEECHHFCLAGHVEADGELVPDPQLRREEKGQQ